MTLRGRTPAELGGVTDLVSFCSMDEDTPETGEGIVSAGNAAWTGRGGGRVSGDGWRGGTGGPGRRDTDPVTRPGISSSSASDDEGDDCRSISMVSDETGLT